MLEFKHISVQKGKRTILKDVSFSLRPHTITALIGLNGSGKSTLLSCLNGGSKYSGSIFFSDKDISMLSLKEKAKLISVLPQSLPSAPITVKALVSMGRNPYVDIGKNLTDKDKEQIEKAVESVGIESLKDKKLNEISGGEKQKAYIAMVLSQNTRVIALDEPTTYMDKKNEREFIFLLKELKEKYKKTLLVVMHDLTLATEIADNIAVLDEGGLIFFGSREDAIRRGIIEKVFDVEKSNSVIYR